MSETVPSDMCTQQRFTSACAGTRHAHWAHVRKYVFSLWLMSSLVQCICVVEMSLKTSIDIGDCKFLFEKSEKMFI